MLGMVLINWYSLIVKLPKGVNDEWNMPKPFLYKKLTSLLPYFLSYQLKALKSALTPNKVETLKLGEVFAQKRSNAFVFLFYLNVSTCAPLASHQKQWTASGSDWPICGENTHGSTYINNQKKSLFYFLYFFLYFFVG